MIHKIKNQAKNRAEMAPWSLNNSRRIRLEKQSVSFQFLYMFLCAVYCPAQTGFLVISKQNMAFIAGRMQDEKICWKIARNKGTIAGAAAHNYTCTHLTRLVVHWMRWFKKYSSARRGYVTFVGSSCINKGDNCQTAGSGQQGGTGQHCLPPQDGGLQQHHLEPHDAHPRYCPGRKYVIDRQVYVHCTK